MITIRPGQGLILMIVLVLLGGLWWAGSPIKINLNNIYKYDHSYSIGHPVQSKSAVTLTLRLWHQAIPDPYTPAFGKESSGDID